MTRDISSRLTSSLIKTVMTLLSVFALVILFNDFKETCSFFGVLRIEPLLELSLLFVFSRVLLVE